MADSKGIKAGAAFVQLFADDSALQRGLKQAEKKLQAWGRAMSAIGAGLIGGGSAILTAGLALDKGIDRFWEYAVGAGTAMSLMSQKTGVTVESLSALSYAADQAGVGTEALEYLFRRMSHTVAAAANGTGEAAQALRQLGLSAAELANLSPDQQLLRFADAVSKVANPTQKAALAHEVFGRSAAQLLPLLNQGAGGIQALTEKAGELGLVMSGESAQAAFEMGKEIKTLWASLRMIAFEIGGAIMPAARQLRAQFQPIVTQALQWVRANSGLVVSLSKAGLIIAGVGAGVVGLGVAATIAGAGLSILGTVLGAVVSPLGLIVAGVGALGYALYKTGGAGKALDYLNTHFADVKATALDTFHGIADAIKGGDVVLAAQIAGAGLKVAFKESTMSLMDFWTDFSDYTLGAWGVVQDQLSAAWAGLKTAWASVTDFLGEKWAKFTESSDTNWTDFMKRVAASLGATLVIMSHMPGMMGAGAQGAMAALDELNKVMEGGQKHFQSPEATAARDEEKAQRRRELEDARAELAKLLKEAAGKGYGGVALPSGRTGTPPSAFNVMGKFDAAGTFSAAAVGRMGYGATLAQKLVDNTGRAADAAEDLLDKVGDGMVMG